MRRGTLLGLGVVALWACACGNPTDASSCAPRPTGDPRWAQYRLPGTEGIPHDYRLVGTESVIDCVTGLEWQRTLDAGTYTQAAAIAYCDGLALAGQSDWRLPSRIELMTLVDYEALAPPEPTIDSFFFPGTPTVRFWTSSPVAGSSDGWHVAFESGYSVGETVTGTNRARCVR